ncbi:MAG: hypothetical protein EB141_20515 [Verrucomicrobia bacterium]|nr:hypothetical protein [Verrucomicrobiota bacterium]NBU07913.1 hypothetical protein [Pseudomonadota bacterium]NDA65506.1 hypothetical protein [Verrucomicrobiota bacterium]NDB77995.1 hypothetical protein [Verrucomicrobiota bacterium]NDD37379.1 hypothetical protein [Verrucomicrobiota bacterium]
MPLVVIGAFAPTVIAIWFVKKRGASKVWLVPALAWAFLELALGPQSALPAGPAARKNSCIANMKQLAEAKRIWATLTKPEASATAQASDLSPFLKGGRMPVCPAGGTYTLGAVNEPPRCSHADKGHVLPSTSGVAGAPPK